MMAVSEIIKPRLSTRNDSTSFRSAWSSAASSSLVTAKALSVAGEWYRNSRKVLSADQEAA